LDLFPVEHELVGVTSREFKSGELSDAAFGEDNRCMQAVCSNREKFSIRKKVILNFGFQSTCISNLTSLAMPDNYL